MKLVYTDPATQLPVTVENVTQVTVTPQNQTKEFDLVDPAWTGTQLLQLRSRQRYLFTAPVTSDLIQVGSKDSQPQ